MGVPGLFSWVRRHFGEVIISDASWSASHPEVSSLFIDLNHILHAATHPEYPFHEPASREEMLEAVLKYIDAILELVQPTELCFVAVDGPPPRAKINQQRSRRFLAAMEAGDRARMQELAANPNPDPNPDPDPDPGPGPDPNPDPDRDPDPKP